jgi:hypothetical protein
MSNRCFEPRQPFIATALEVLPQRPADSGPGQGAYHCAGSAADGADKSAYDQTEKPHQSPPHSVATRADSTQVKRHVLTFEGRIAEIDLARVRNY